jgi:hypothetical protein
LPCFSEVPPSGFGYPLDGFSHRCPRDCFFNPHALGLRSSGPYSEPTTQTKFPRSVPPLRFPAKHICLAAALRRFSFASPAAPPAFGLCFKPERGQNPLELLRLSGLPSRALWKSTCLFHAPHALALSASSRNKKPAPQGIVSRKVAPPFLRRAPACLTFPTD